MREFLSGCVSVLGPSRLFSNAGYAFSAIQFVEYVVERDVEVGEQDHEVEDQVSTLANSAFPIGSHGGDHGFHRFLTDFLRDLPPTPCRQLGDIGLRWVSRSPLPDGLFKIVEG